MTDKELLEAAKAISENCKNREKCEGCPFEHTGKNNLDNFCIVQETVCCWKEYIKEMQEDA
jgi:hypothetical protein